MILKFNNNKIIIIIIRTTIPIIPTITIWKQHDISHKLQPEKAKFEVTLNKEINKYYFKERSQERLL